jgi:CRISPR-associated protein Csb1
VRRLTRSAQYVPAIEYVGQELLDEPADKATKDSYSVRGFIHVPASASHGGVIARGGIRREATLSLAALRLLSSGGDADRTRALHRYVLGLAITAFTSNVSGYLRQGCNLVLDASKPQPRHVEEVYPTGERKPFTLSHDDALAYARAAAVAFGVGESRTVEFDKERAKRDVTGDGDKKKSKKKSP